MRAVGSGVAAVALALAGCADGSVLEGPRTASTIGDRLEEAYSVEVDQVECPEEIPVADGGEFRCTARVGDESVPVDVVQTDDEGTLEVTSQRALLSTDAVEADIAATLADRFARDDVEVTCDGPAVRVEEPEATFACAAVDGDETEAVEVTVRDARGGLTYAVAGDDG